MIVARRKTLDTVFICSMAALFCSHGAIQIIARTVFEARAWNPIILGFFSFLILYGIILLIVGLGLGNSLFRLPPPFHMVIVGRRSLLFKRRKKPFRVIQRENCVAYIPRRAALVLKSGEEIRLPRLQIVGDLLSIEKALFESWYSKGSWQHLRTVWRSANAPADGWVWGLAGGGGWAVLVAVTAWLVMGSVWAFTAVLGAAVLATLVALYFLRWKTPFVYALPPQYDVAESNTSAESKQNSTALPDH